MIFHFHFVNYFLKFHLFKYTLIPILHVWDFTQLMTIILSYID